MLLDSHTSLYIHNTMVQYLADRNKWLLSEEPGNETLRQKRELLLEEWIVGGDISVYCSSLASSLR